MQCFHENTPDDDGLADFLLAESLKPSVMPYRVFARRVLEYTAAALEDGWPAETLSVEVDYAFTALQDDVAPSDPRAFRKELERVVADVVGGQSSGEQLQAAVEMLLDRLSS